jgi:hypothetical protein
MSGYTSKQIHEAFEWTMKEVHRRYAAGELDMSGRFYTDEELDEGAATEGRVPERLKTPASAA